MHIRDRIALVPTPAGFEAALDRGETRALRVDIGPAEIAGRSVFHLPVRPDRADWRRTYQVARAFIRGAAAPTTTPPSPKKGDHA
jgi:hypothetical protein